MSRPHPNPPQPDPPLEGFDGGLGVLEFAGHTVGYLSSELGTFVTPFSPRQEQHQVWFTIFDSDGAEGSTLDDYPPFFVVQDLLEREEFNLSSAVGPDQPCHFRWLSGDEEEVARHLIESKRQAPVPRQELSSQLKPFRNGLWRLDHEGELVGYLRTSLGLSRSFTVRTHSTYFATTDCTNPAA